MSTDDGIWVKRFEIEPVAAAHRDEDEQRREHDDAEQDREEQHRTEQFATDVEADAVELMARTAGRLHGNPGAPGRPGHS